jgi:hypothetical protein
MTSQREDAGGCGCCAVIIAIFVVIALVIAAALSVAALIDPFSWIPPIGDLFGDCNDKLGTAADQCDLGTRYPGLWWHVIINLLYALAALVLLLMFALALPEFRKARSRRFESDAAVERYRQARQTLALLGGLLGGLAAVPIIAALV